MRTRKSMAIFGALWISLVLLAGCAAPSEQVETPALPSAPIGTRGPPTAPIARIEPGGHTAPIKRIDTYSSRPGAGSSRPRSTRRPYPASTTPRSSGSALSRCWRSIRRTHHARAPCTRASASRGPWPSTGEPSTSTPRWPRPTSASRCSTSRSRRSRTHRGRSRRPCASRPGTRATSRPIGAMSFLPCPCVDPFNSLPGLQRSYSASLRDPLCQRSEIFVTALHGRDVSADGTICWLEIEHRLARFLRQWHQTSVVLQ